MKNNSIKKFLSFLMVFTILFSTANLSFTEGVETVEPSIETTLKNMTTKADKITFDLWTKDFSGKKISTSNVEVTNNGKLVGINWDDLEKTSYTLNLEIGTNNVEIKVSYNGKDYIQKYILIREEAEDGDVIGSFTFSMEAFTVGLGYLIEPIQVDIHKGRNAAQELDEVIRTHGYDYEKTGTLESSFYLENLLDDTNTVYKDTPRIPDALKEKLNGVYDEEEYDPEYGLGEFDFNYMSGWMYAVNNVFPNVGFADKYLQDGDVMRVQFTLAYGNDIGGADAMGGGYENNFFPKVDKDELTKKVAEINSSDRKDEYLKVSKIKKAYDDAIKVLQTVNATQEDIDKSLSNLEKAVNNIVEVVSIEAINDIEVDFGTSKEKVLEKLPKKIKLNLSNGTKEEIDINWTSEEYDGNNSGEYIFVGNYELPEQVTGEKPKVNVKVVVKEEVVTVKEIDPIEDIEVDFGTNKEDAITKLPNKIKLNLSNGTTEGVNVSWTSEVYNGNKAGEYKFVGSYELPEGVTGDKSEANVKVRVKEESKPEVNKAKLEEVINKAEKIDLENKTEESIKVLKEAIAKGKEILNKEEVAQEELDNAVKAIETAIENLKDKEEPEPKPEVDKTRLEEIINEAENIELEGKTEDSIKVLKEAIAKGKEILNKEEVAQEELDNAVKNIEVAMENLKDEEKPEPKPEVDKTKLEEIINKAESINTEGKTEESIEALKEAIAKSKEIFNKEEVTQKEIDNAVKDIEIAIKNLEDKKDTEPKPEVDKIKLEEIINKAKNINTEGKTENSIKVLNEAIAKGKEILNKEEATQEEVDNVAKSIEAAIESLKDKEASKPQPNKPNKPEKPNKSTKPGKVDKPDNKSTKPNIQDKSGKAALPKTGESSMLWISILGAILLVVGTKLWIGKKKEREA